MAKKRKMAGPAAVARKKQRMSLGRGPGAGGGDERGGRGGRGKPESGGGKENAFETLWTRKKFDVLGKKQTKGEKKRVGQSRSQAIEKRKQTLLTEFKQRGKNNKFVDRRFGEREDDLPEDDKAIMRFQKERQAQFQKKSKFTLPDDDGEEETLTHGGMALSNVDDFNDNDSLQDDDELADLDEDAVRHLNFGGGSSEHAGEDGGFQQRKSKKEIMEDIISKSKFYKAQKAKEKEEDLELKEKLDSDFSELVRNRALLSLRPTRKDRLKSLLSKDSTKAETSTPVEEDKPDEFDKLVKEMTFDIRGKAGDRLKTAEEIVKEEHERLEDLEKKRKKRMLGVADSDEESNEGSDEETDERKRKKKKRLEASGDDLGENFVLDDEEEDGKGWVHEVLARKGEEADGGEDGSGEEDEDSAEEDGDSEEDEDDDEDEEEEEGDGDDANGIFSGEEWSDGEDLPIKKPIKVKVARKETSAMENGKPSNKSKKKAVVGKGTHADKASNEQEEVEVLPFVIDAPQTLAEFRALIDDISTEDVGVAIQRIRTCNAISLAAENRKKMQIFYNVLLQYFGFLAMQRPFSLSRVNMITKPLIVLSAETPYFAVHCARQRLVQMHGQLTEKLKNSDGSSCWPSLRTLLLLRYWSLIFPRSDYRHPVMTPATLLMAEYLMRCRVTSARDILVGSFLCNILLSVLTEARRYCPEVLNFILAILVSALPADASLQVQSLCPAFLVELVCSNPWLQLKGGDTGTVSSFALDFFTMMTLEDSAHEFDSDLFRCGILQSILQSLKSFVGLYGDIVSFPEIFSPLLVVLQTMGEAQVLPEKLEGLRLEVAELIDIKLRDSESLRQPLRMRVKKPTPIKQFNPKFEENYVQGRNYDPDRGRAETKKLKKLVKSEAKGAARELRKDNYFLLQEKRKEKAASEEERKEKYGKAMQFLQEQEHAFKSGQLGKGKGRKRRK